MMISPEMFIATLKDAPYDKLIKERDRLIRSIRKYEKEEKSGSRSDEKWLIRPSPDVIYQCELEYLSKLCLFMSDKYRDGNA